MKVISDPSHGRFFFDLACMSVIPKEKKIAAKMNDKKTKKERKGAQGLTVRPLASPLMLKAFST